MGFLSRLLGEMPEETKYKPSSEFKIKTSKGQIKLDTSSYKNKTQETVKSFSELFEDKYPKEVEYDSYENKDTNLSSFEKLEEEMEKPDKPLNYEALDVRELFEKRSPKLSREEVEEAQKNAFKIMGIIGIGILVFIGLVFMFGYDAVKPIFSWIWILIWIPFLLFGKKGKGLSKLTK